MHAYTVAAAGAVFGLDYPVARLVSILAFVACAVMLCREVLLTSRSRTIGFVCTVASAGFMAASFNYTGHWYDLVRVDAVFIAWLVLAALLSLPPASHLARRRLSYGRAVAAGLALTAALYSKQTAMFFVPWICLYAVWRHRKSGLVLSLATASSSLALLGAWQWATDGRFWGYVFVVMSRHTLVLAQGVVGATHAVLFAPYLLLVPGVALWAWRRRLLERRTVFWLGMLLCATAASLITSAKVGAFRNNLITLGLLVGPVAGMLVRDVARPRALGSSPRYGLSLLSLLAASWMMQHYVAGGLVPMPHGTGAQVPSDDEWRLARELNALVRTAKGGIIMPAHSFLPIRNGHTNGQIHEQGHIDLMGSGASVVDVNVCLDHLDAHWMIADEPRNPYLHRSLLTLFDYRAELPPFARTNVGNYCRPVELYERKPRIPARQPRQRVRVLFDFEEGSYEGWLREGNAFDHGPSRTITGYQHIISGHRGQYLANSYHPTLLDTATGRLQSPAFTVDRDHLGFRAGGGNPDLRIELVVDGQTVRIQHGFDNELELLLPYTWDVRGLAGKVARVVIVDASVGHWGHILADAFELYDLDGAPESGSL
jgi:hypothetical protein